MRATATRLRLDGYADAAIVNDVFMSCMVDVAHIDEVTSEAIFVVPDSAGCIGLDDPKDVEWLSEVIIRTLKEHGQAGVRVTLVHDAVTSTSPRKLPGRQSLYVALLRGINVGGHNCLAMSDLRDLVGQLGFAGARSLLQSGNLVFQGSGRGRTGAALERMLEEATAERLGARADYIVRTAGEWKTIVAGNPFAAEARDDPSHLVVMFLKTPVAPASVEALASAIKGRERLHGDGGGRELYIYYPAGIGKSKLSAALIERQLRVRGTARNWNTVLKLAALCE
jgi:uncharacterized protein (DUF1697 family)